MPTLGTVALDQSGIASYRAQYRGPGGGMTRSREGDKVQGSFNDHISKEGDKVQAG